MCRGGGGKRRMYVCVYVCLCVCVEGVGGHGTSSALIVRQLCVKNHLVLLQSSDTCSDSYNQQLVSGSAHRHT